MTETDQQFDVILLGATGFTGQITAAYLLREQTLVRYGHTKASRSKEDYLLIIPTMNVFA